MQDSPAGEHGVVIVLERGAHVPDGYGPDDGHRDRGGLVDAECTEGRFALQPTGRNRMASTTARNSGSTTELATASALNTIDGARTSPNKDPGQTALVPQDRGCLTRRVSPRGRSSLPTPLDPPRNAGITEPALRCRVRGR